MSMLAEPRSRQKWSDDPRNTRWASDKSKFGYQMMTKMGWSEGKGLGQNESGDVSHVKVRRRKNNAGIGVKVSHDDDWIAQQDDFNALLSQLNKGTNPANETKITSLEERVKLSKKKILYTKFVKSKDLSNASSHDLDCIFGQRRKSAPATPQMSDVDSDSNDSAASCPVADGVKEHGITTVNSGLSVAEYFAKKMAALKQARGASNNSFTNVEVPENKSVDVVNENNESSESSKVSFFIGEEEIFKKNKEKTKKEKSDEIITEISDENFTKMKDEEITEIEESNNEEESNNKVLNNNNESSVKKKKKKKRREEVVEENTGELLVENKKKKKRKIAVDEEQQKSVKKKKKKKKRDE